MAESEIYTSGCEAVPPHGPSDDSPHRLGDSLAVFVCPRCGVPMVSMASMLGVEHGAHSEERIVCRCGEPLTVTLKITREND